MTTKIKSARGVSEEEYARQLSVVIQHTFLSTAANQNGSNAGG